MSETVRAALIYGQLLCSALAVCAGAFSVYCAHRARRVMWEGAED